MKKEKLLTLEEARKLLFVQPPKEMTPAEEGAELARKSIRKFCRELKKIMRDTKNVGK
jgi:flagellar motility protein MotE (MotC chaperone)